MNPGCPDASELTRFLDGEVTANRGAELEKHVLQCGSCRGELEAQRQLVARVAAPWDGIPGPKAVESVLSRLGESAPRRVEWPIHVWPWAGGALAFAGLLIVVLLPPPRSHEFQPRGEARPLTLRATFGANFYVSGEPPVRLRNGDSVSGNTRFRVGYRNLSPSAPVYALAFAVDSKNVVHWLYPAYANAASNPEAVRLEPASADKLLPDAVELESPAPGPMRLVLVASANPGKRVSDVESLTPEQLRPASLSALWPDAAFDEITVQVRANPGESK